MLTSEQIKVQLEEMKARSLKGELSSSDKSFIVTNYERITFKEFTGTSCSRCYADAFIEMYTSFKKYGLRDMPKFRLKAGVVLKSAQFTEVVTNDNLTDELALKWLKDNPNRANLFATLPDNWETMIAETENKKEQSKAKKQTKNKAEKESKDKNETPEDLEL